MAARPKRHRPVSPKYRLETLETRVLFSADGPLAALGALPAAVSNEAEIVARVTSSESQGERALEGNAAITAAEGAAHELVIIDAGVPDLEVLLADIARRGEAAPRVVVLEASADPLARLGELLTAEQGLTAVHLISHGADGALELSGERVTILDLLARAGDIVAWRGAFADAADFLLYGCDVAASGEGRAFVDTLARLSQTDVAASNDVTGARGLGGNWTLEYRRGEVQGELAFGEALQENYSASLATAPVLVNNALTITEGGTVVLGATELSATDAETAAGVLAFSISSLSGGRFEFVASPGVAITSFTQQEVTDGDVRFVHDGSKTAPAYAVTVSDGALTDGPSAASITYTNVNEAPNFHAAGVPTFTSHDIAIDADAANSVTTADVDGDGDVDVLSASYNDDRIVWYENDGSESFTAYTIASDADGASSVTTADVDGDGDVDVLSASYTDDRIVWYENDGSESFTAQTIATDANGAYAVSVADVDGDGDVDVLSASAVDDRIVWYENDGSENFTTRTIAADANGAISVTTSDVDGDGDVDVLSASLHDDRIVWYENDGSESFTTHTIVTDAVGARSVTTADVDGDGDVDVLSASLNDNRIVWYENDGSESFTTHNISTVANGARSIATANLDGDGDVDVLSALRTDDRIAWYENNSDTLDGNPTYLEGGPAVVLDGDVSVSDTELDALNGGSGNYTGAELSVVRTGAANAEDVFGFADGNGLTLVGGNLIKNGQSVASFDTSSTAGELVVTFTDAGGEIPTTSDVENALQQITYANASDAPPASVVLDWVLDDGNTGSQGAGGASQATGSTTVTITAVNDAPVISSTNSVAVLENQTAVLTVTATDADGDTPVYTIASGVDAALFSIDLNSGVLTFDTAPDFQSPADADTDNVYEVTIEADDGIGGTALQAIDVTVIDVNEAASDTYTTDAQSLLTVAAPGVLVNDPSNAALQGNTVLGFDASADTDADATWSSDVGTADLALAPGVTYTTAPDSPPAGITAAFDLDGTGGATSTALDSLAEIDGTQSASIELWLRPDTLSGTQTLIDTGDGGVGGLLLTLEGSFIRLNIEDDSGTYQSGQSTSGIAAGSWHHLVLTIDMSGGAKALEVWVDGVSRRQDTLYSGGNWFQNWAEGAFGLGAVNGTAANGYSSNDFAGQISDLRVHDKVLSTAEIVHNRDQASGAGATPFVTGFDDSATLGSVSVNADGSFAYDPDGNFDALTAAQSGIDSFTYTSDDGTGAISTATVTITVNGVNDDPVFTSSALVSVVENQTAALTVSSSDVDGDTPVYTIASGADAALFSIDLNSGVLTFDTAPDFESPADADTDNVYEVTVEADDGNGGTALQAIVVTVTDGNDAPELVNNALTITEGGTVVLGATELSATDAETASGTLGFSVSSVGGGRFERVAAPGVAITNFAQQEVTDGDVQFVHDGGEVAPAYSVTVSDGSLTDGPSAASITYTNANDAPNFHAAGVPAFASHDVAIDADAAYSVTTADVDGDGDVDVLSASSNDDRIVWYENDGNEGFTAHTIASDADGALSVTTADVDGDGDVDVLSASSGDDRIVWYENDGNESFAAHTIASDADAAVTVTTADVDSDGDVDVLSASFLDDRIVWYENDGSENFTTRTIATDADGGRSVTTADVDGDGDVDVLSASYNDDRIVWYENDGSESFTTRTIAADADGAMSVTTADVDGDGDVDVLSASTLDDRIVWYENDGSESFSTRTIAADADGAWSVTTVDVDGDGDVDVLSASDVDDRIVWYENDGSESFTAHDIASDADGGRSVTTADVDGDGDVDVLSASLNDDRIAWYENNPSTLDGNPTYLEGGPAVVLDGDVSVSDAELDTLNGGNGNYAGAELSVVRTGAANSDDVFSFADGNGLTLVGGNLIKNGQSVAVFDTSSTAGELVVTFTDAGGEIPTTSDVENALQQITYVNTSNAPPASVVLDWVLDDGNTGAQGGGGAKQATGSTTVTMTPTNDAPELVAIGNQSVDEGSTLTFTATASDGDVPADTLTYSLDAASLALGMTINASTGAFSWTPAESQGGTTPSVTVTVTDDGTGALTDSETFTVTVNDINSPPVLGAIGDQSVDEGSTLTFTATATDADDPSDTLTYSLDAASLALGMTINASSGAFSWTPNESQGGSTPSVTVTVTDDGTGTLADSETFTVTVNDVNSAPVLGAIGDQSVNEGSTLTFTATATDPDDPSDTLSYSLDAASIALGMSINASTGAFSWTPAESQGGTTPSVTVTVTDDGTGALTDSETFTVTVNDINNPPVLGAIGDQSVDEGSTLSFTASATDSDDPSDTLTYSLDAASIALGMSINASTGAFSWTPGENQGGTTPSVTVTVTDDGTGALTDSETFTVTVNDINSPPVLGAIGDQSVDEGSTLTFTATATDPDDPSDTLSYSLDAASIALGMTINASTGAFSWTPSESQGGTTPSVTVTVTDDGTGALTDSETFTVTVNDINSAPVLGAIGDQSVDEGSTLTFTVTATDADDPSDTLTYSLDAASLALGMTINLSSGAFSWTPAEDQGGTTPSVTVTVTDDGTGTLADSETFTVTVNDINSPPVLGAIGDQSVNEGSTLAFTATATDPDDPSDTLTYSLDAASLALGMTINASTGAFSWTPAESQGGTTPSVTVTVTDDGTGALTDSETFTVMVNDVNSAPVLGAIGDQSVNEGSTLAFTATAADPDDPSDTLTFSLDAASLALGMTINASTGAFSWTPGESQGGTTPSVTVTVTDDGTGALTDSETFTVTVNEINSAPVLGAIGDQSVNEGSTLTFTATATDSDDPADTLSYSLDAASLALGMTINASTGAFSWTPNESQGGTPPSVTVTVTDDGTGALIDSETFTVTVNDINGAPEITSDGGAATASVSINENQTAVTTVTATDVDDGATQAYSLTGGADRSAFTIDASTGVLSFVSAPDHESKGSYEVGVSVTDGALTDRQLLTVLIDDVDEIPAARDDTLSAREDTVLNINVASELLANDADPEGSELRLVDVTNPSHGVLTAAIDGTYEYRPDADFNGTDTFSYVVEDTGGQRVTANVVIEVEPVNDPPTVAPSTAERPSGRPTVIDSSVIAIGSMDMAENDNAVFHVEAMDVEGQSVTFALKGTDAAMFEIDPVSGALRSIVPLDFENPADVDGDNHYDLIIVLRDVVGGESRLPLSIVAADVNEAPTLGDSEFVLSEGYAGQIAQLYATDPDRDDLLSFEILGAVGDGGANGLTLLSDGRLLANETFVGVHVFEVRVVDAEGLSSTGRMTVRVLAFDATSGEPDLGAATAEFSYELLSLGGETDAAVPTMQRTDEIDSTATDGDAGGLAERDAQQTLPTADRLAPMASIPLSGIELSFPDRLPASFTILLDQARSSESIEREVIMPSFESRIPEAISAQLREAIAALNRGIEDYQSTVLDEERLIKSIATAAGVTMSIGTAIWLLQSRLLLAAALAALPLWRPFDPVPILIAGGGRRAREDAEEEDERRLNEQQSEPDRDPGQRGDHG